MKINLFLILLSLSFTVSVQATDKVIYGEDGRVLTENSTNKLFMKLAESTAAMVKNSAITYEFDGILAKLSSKTLENSMRVCKDERFSQSLTTAMCSGFLIGEDLLVTAGHCATTEALCKQNSWVFDYRQDLLDTNGGIAYVTSENVYTCKKLIGQALDRETQNDYAVIQLDRKVVGRAPLKFRKEGKIELGTEIVVIGHPSGLPSIIADGAKVRSNDNEFFFQANLDTFGGNSGSAVFDAKTGLVEGILVRGETDYKYDAEASCYRVFQCNNDNCRGEDVTRMSSIPELKTKE